MKPSVTLGFVFGPTGCRHVAAMKIVGLTFDQCRDVLTALERGMMSASAHQEARGFEWAVQEVKRALPESVEVRFD